MTPRPSDRDRFVLLGLAHVRAGWFREVARWATGGAMPVDFVMCLSADELRIRLASGRVHSALLLDGGLPAADRSLVAAAAGRGCAVLVVDERGRPTDWLALGVAAVLEPDFDGDDLLRVLRLHAVPVRGVDRDETNVSASDEPHTHHGSLVVVTGPGGTGASLCAMALARHVARTGEGSVLLADLARHAELAMLHDIGDVLPGLPELVEAHRRNVPAVGAVRGLTFSTNGYDLLLGLRRARDWTALGPEPLRRAMNSLRSAYDTVIADVTGDVEGERECGSIDVEERNSASRLAVDAADAVVVVGSAGPKGTHALTRLLRELVEHGTDVTRIVPVVNRSPRRRSAQRQLMRALEAVPVFLPDRRDVDGRLLHAAGAPPELGPPLARAVVRAITASGPRLTAPHVPVPVRPGSVGALAPAEP